MLTKRLCPRRCEPADEHPASGGASDPLSDTSGGADPAKPAASSDDLVLDADALARLRELDPNGENQLIARVVKAFETSAARLLPQMHEAHRAADQAGVRHVAHTLKSSSASIGAVKLSQLCADIESMIRTGQAQNLDSRVEAMSAEVAIVLQALKRLLNATP